VPATTVVVSWQKIEFTDTVDTSSPIAFERTGEPPPDPSRVWLYGLKHDHVIYLLFGSHERVVQSHSGGGHSRRIQLVPNRGYLFSRYVVAPLPTAEFLDTPMENPLACPTIHVKEAAVLNDVLFHVPTLSTTSVCAHDEVLLPKIFLNSQACGAILRPFSASIPDEFLESSH
jgi:hypothetical protein